MIEDTIVAMKRKNAGPSPAVTLSVGIVIGISLALILKPLHTCGRQSGGSLLELDWTKFVSTGVEEKPDYEQAVDYAANTCGPLLPFDISGLTPADISTRLRGMLVNVTETNAEAYGKSFLVSHHGSQELIAGYLIRDRSWEPKLAGEMERYVPQWPNRNFVDPVTFIDMGANIGVHSLNLASKGSRVIAFEPLEKNMRKFCESIYANEFQDRVLPFMAGVSSEEKYIVMASEVWQLVLHQKTVARSFATEEKADEYAASIVEETGKRPGRFNLKSFDLMYERNEIPAEFFKGEVLVKIDVEGHELEAYTGAKNMFENVLAPSIHFFTIEYAEVGTEEELDAKHHFLKHFQDRGFYLMDAQFSICPDEKYGVCSEQIRWDRPVDTSMRFGTDMIITKKPWVHTNVH